MDTSGFQVLLARLPDDLRTKYCAQALQEELSDVQARLSACSEAMAHAAQVEAAIASLEATNNGSGIRSSTLSVSLSELRTLHQSFQQQMQSLLQPSDAAQRAHKSAKAKTKTASDPASAPPAATATEPDNEDDQQAQEVYAKQLKVLEKIERYVTKRRRATWLSDAVDLACEFTRASSAEESAPLAKLLSKRQRKAWTRVVVRAMEALRAALLECAADNMKLLPRFVKTLKRFAKHHTNFADLHAASAELFAVKEQELAAKEKRLTEKAAVAGADKKPKKRKLSDASVASSTASAMKETVVKVSRSSPAPAPALAPAPVKEQHMSITEARKAMGHCTRETKQIKAQFSPWLYQSNLTRVVDISKALSSEFTKDDVSDFVSNVFSMYHHVDRVKPESQRMDAIAALEATMARILGIKEMRNTAPYVSTLRTYRDECQRTLQGLRQKQSERTETSPVAPPSTTRESKPVKASAPVPPLEGKGEGITDIRAALAHCDREVKQLRTQFTPELFGSVLTRVSDVSKRLSREFTKDDVTSLVSSVLTTFEHVERVTPASKCMSELKRLEATLQRIVSAKDVSMSDKRRTMVRGCCTDCRRLLRHLRQQHGRASSKPSAPKPKPAGAHLHFGD